MLCAHAGQRSEIKPFVASLAPVPCSSPLILHVVHGCCCLLSFFARCRIDGIPSDIVTAYRMRALDDASLELAYSDESEDAVAVLQRLVSAERQPDLDTVAFTALLRDVEGLGNGMVDWASLRAERIAVGGPVDERFTVRQALSDAMLADHALLRRFHDERKQQQQRRGAATEEQREHTLRSNRAFHGTVLRASERRVVLSWIKVLQAWLET